MLEIFTEYFRHRGEKSDTFSRKNVEYFFIEKVSKLLQGACSVKNQDMHLCSFTIDIQRK